MSLEAVAEPSVFTPARRHDTDSWTVVVADVVHLAERISGTEFVPRGIRDSVPATAAAMLYGREVGLPPMTALSAIHVIDGRPGMSAEGMRALVFAAGHELVFDESTGAICKMRARRSGSSSWTPLTWTIDMARAANLIRRENWSRYPRAMLVARCTTDLCRMVFPDVIHGLRSLEEIDDMGQAGRPVPVAPEVSPAVRSVGRRGTHAATSYPSRDVEETPLPEPPTPPLPGEEVTEPEADAPTAEGPEDGAPMRTDAPSSGETEDPGPRLVNRAVVRMIQIRFKRLGLGDDDRGERLNIVGQIVGHPVTSVNSLTAIEGEHVLATISTVENVDDLRALVDAYGMTRDTAAEEETTEAAEAVQDDEIETTEEDS